MVLVFSALFICAGTPTVAQTYRVAGMAVNDADGGPLGRTQVSLAEVQDRRKAESVITDANGRFEFRGVPAGKFSLEGARRNFMVTTYQWHEGFSTAIVTGAGLDTENLVLRLIPLGSIAGRVIDETGEPVRNANVKLATHRERLGEDRVFGQGYVLTDDDGKYEFRDLMPAEYFVSVAAKPWYAVRPVWANENGVRTRTDTIAPELNVAYARTYYNGATEQEGATPLTVAKGERLTADIHHVDCDRGCLGNGLVERGRAGKVFGARAGLDDWRVDDCAGDTARGGGGADAVEMQWRMSLRWGYGANVRKRASVAGCCCSRFVEFADDGPFAGWAGLTVVTYEEMFDDFVDAGVLEAGEFSVLIKGKIAGAPDLA